MRPAQANYCFKRMAAFALPENAAEIKVFGKTTALVIERFDRKWTQDGRFPRIPQEDLLPGPRLPAQPESEGGNSRLTMALTASN